MIPGVTLGPPPAGPVAARPAAAAAAATPAVGVAVPFGELVAWLGLVTATPGATAPLAGRGRWGRASDQAGGDSGAPADTIGTETGVPTTAPGDPILATPVVVWVAPPATVGVADGEGDWPAVSDTAAIPTAVAASPSAQSSPMACTTTMPAPAGQGESLPAPGSTTATAMPSGRSGAVTGPPADVDLGEIDRDVASLQRPASAAEVSSRLSGDRARSLPGAAGLDHAAVETVAPGAAAVVASTSAQKGEAAATDPAPAGGVVIREAKAASPVEAPVTVDRAEGPRPDRAPGAHAGETNGAVSGGKAFPAGAPASETAPEPIVEASARQAAGEAAASAALRLRRGLAVRIVAPMASPSAPGPLPSGREAAVTPSLRGAYASPSAAGVGEMPIGADGRVTIARRDPDLLVPLPPGPAPLEARDRGRAAIGLAAPGQPEGASLDEVLPTQIIRTIRLQWQAGQGEARVQLRPDYLGELTVAVKVDRGAVIATLHAEAPEVRRWIESHSGALRDALAEQGLRLDRLVVTDQHGRQDAPDPERQHRQDRDDGEAPPRRRRGRPAAADTAFDVPTFDSPERTFV